MQWVCCFGSFHHCLLESSLVGNWKPGFKSSLCHLPPGRCLTFATPTVFGTYPVLAGVLPTRELLFRPDPHSRRVENGERRTKAGDSMAWREPVPGTLKGADEQSGDLVFPAAGALPTIYFPVVLLTTQCWATPLSHYSSCSCKRVLDSHFLSSSPPPRSLHTHTLFFSV